MKLSIIGDVEEGKEGGRLRTIDAFIEDHKGGRGVVLSAGSTRLLHFVDKHAKSKGYPSVVMGNATQLAVLNADKVLILHSKAYVMDDVVELCKKYDKPFMEIK